MKVIGYLEIYDYGQRKMVSHSRHSTVTLCRDKGEPILFVHQPNYISGLKYTISQNIVKVFYRFVTDGKATVRLNEPTHELRLHNESIRLKAFLGLLHTCHKATTPTSVIQPNPKFQKQMPTVGIITSAKDLSAFDKLSSRVAHLRVTNVQMDDLPDSTKRLKDLAILDINFGGLQKFPSHLADFPLLTSLILTNNSFSSIKYWDFLSIPNIQQRLRLLDLRYNKLTIVPPRICVLQELVTLKLDHNNLVTLPHTLHRMTNLRYLTVSDNKIRSYPFSLFNLRQVSIDISGNPHNFPEDGDFQVACNVILDNEKEVEDAWYSGLKSLKELASRAVFDGRLPYEAYGLPETLTLHLDEAKECHNCNKSCFNQYFITFGSAFMRKFVPDSPSAGVKVTNHFFLCSRSCALETYPRLFDRSGASLCYLAT